MRNLPAHGWVMLAILAVATVLGMMAIFRYAEGEPLNNEVPQPSLRQRCLEANDYNYNVCRDLD